VQLVQLQEDQEKLEAAGLRTVSISYDSVNILKRFAEERGITYTMLSDEGSKTIDAYGIRNTEVEPGTKADGIPYPGTFLVGADGVIKGKLFLDGYRKRHDNDALIQLAEEVIE